MKRTYRLFAPALAFSGIGLLALLAARTEAFTVRGGYPGAAAYAFAWQLALTAFLLVTIEDFGDRSGPRVRLPDLSFDGYWRQLWTVYRRSFLASLLSGFGLGATVAMVTIGLTDRDNEYVVGLYDYPRGHNPLGLMLLATAVIAALLRTNWAGFAGWCSGFAVACALTEIRLVSGPRVEDILLEWIPSAIALIVLRAAVIGGRRLRRRIGRWNRQRRTPLPQPAR